MGSVNNIMVKRNFQKQPITQEEIIYCHWYPVTDDTIGGWAISNVPEPVSELNPYNGKFELGSFMTEDEAKHIAYVHNAWYSSVVAMSYMDNLGTMFLTYCNHAELTRTH
jgi:hypothetical protein